MAQESGASLPTWLGRHYLTLFNGILLVLMASVLAAPMFEKIGWKTPAEMIYALDGYFCHQFAFRSWFLFGEQSYYPLTAIKGMLTYSLAFHAPAENLFMARALQGNEIMGYKMAICQRDFAMYGMMLVFGILFSLANKRIKRIPFWLWLALGVLPLAVDGISQLGGSAMGEILHIVARESTPLLRTLTGGFFGVLSAWYILPSIESSNWRKRSMKMEIMD